MLANDEGKPAAESSRSWAQPDLIESRPFLIFNGEGLQQKVGASVR